MSRKKSNEEAIMKFRWLLFLPIIVVVGIIPLIVRYTTVPINDPKMRYLWNAATMGDLFSQTKAQCLLVVVAIMLFILFLTFTKKDFKYDKMILVMMSGLGVYALMTIISAIFSPYSHTAMWGAPDRGEGVFVLLAYVSVMLYAFYMTNRSGDYRYVSITLAILSVIMLFVGITQYVGNDILLSNDIVRELVVPSSKYPDIAEGLTHVYEGGNMHGTLFHYNYVGSFAALITPFFIALIFGASKWLEKILYIVGAISGIGLMIGSTARSGMIGIGISVLVLIIIGGRQLIKKWYITIGVVVIAGIVLVGFNSVTNGEIFRRIPSLIQDVLMITKSSEAETNYLDALPIQGIEHEGRNMDVLTPHGKLRVDCTEARTLKFYDDANEVVLYAYEDGTYKTIDARFSNISFEEETWIGDVEGLWIMNIGDATFGVMATPEEGVHYSNKMTGEFMTLDEAESIGFKGKERMGSARGYIWSRSLPLIKNNLIIGKGPDSFIAQFPQNDILGLWYAYGTPYMTVDKPHNMYLQIAINEGVIALIGFFVLVIGYIIQSIKLYAWRIEYNEAQSVGTAFFVGVVGYLGSGLFNDSVVSVAPIFWVMLGMGMSINYMVKVSERKMFANMPHATIKMKTRKHIMK
ncbi:MAG: O-antigen ligase family protein [Cellulosilyticaceae bacterium]